MFCRVLFILQTFRPHPWKKKEKKEELNSNHTSLHFPVRRKASHSGNKRWTPWTKWSLSHQTVVLIESAKEAFQHHIPKRHARCVRKAPAKHMVEKTEGVLEGRGGVGGWGFPLPSSSDDYAEDEPEDSLRHTSTESHIKKNQRMPPSQEFSKKSLYCVLSCISLHAPALQSLKKLHTFAPFHLLSHVKMCKTFYIAKIVYKNQQKVTLFKAFPTRHTYLFYLNIQSDQGWPSIVSVPIGNNCLPHVNLEQTKQKQTPLA